MKTYTLITKSSKGNLKARLEGSKLKQSIDREKGIGMESNLRLMSCSHFQVLQE